MAYEDLSIFIFRCGYYKLLRTFFKNSPFVFPKTFFNYSFMSLLWPDKVAWNDIDEFGYMPEWQYRINLELKYPSPSWEESVKVCV